MYTFYSEINNSYNKIEAIKLAKYNYIKLILTSLKLWINFYKLQWFLSKKLYFIKLRKNYGFMINVEIK